MRHIVRFSLVSLAVLFADAAVFGRDERESANSSGRLRLWELRKTRERSLDFRDSPGDQAATETTTLRNKAVTLKPFRSAWEQEHGQSAGVRR